MGRENVQGGTDCGFSQGPFAARVHESIQWAKLRSLAEGAEIATRELWGAGRDRLTAVRIRPRRSGGPGVASGP